jgi:hypothetical protein
MAELSPRTPPCAGGSPGRSNESGSRPQWFWLHLAVYVTGQLFLIAVWALSGGGHPWFGFSLFGWGIVLAVHGIYAFVMKTPEEIMIERAARAVAIIRLTPGTRPRTS